MHAIDSIQTLFQYAIPITVYTYRDNHCKHWDSDHRTFQKEGSLRPVELKIKEEIEIVLDWLNIIETNSLNPNVGK